MGEGLFQPTHLLLILVIALVVFGPSKLGDLGSTLGKSIKEFRHAMKEPDEETPPKPPNSTH
ncbi:MAG TPA: twin-arginine translocase TatA/TatE family subunit [Chloroflexota bacterium]|jgi:sec-independent protein translocase protein TatA